MALALAMVGSCDCRRCPEGSSFFCDEGSRGRGARARCEHVRADSKPNNLRAADAAGDAAEVIPIASGHTLTIATTHGQRFHTPIRITSHDCAACGLAAATAGEPAAATAVEFAVATAGEPATCLSALGYSPLSGEGMGRCWKRDKKDGGDAYKIENHGNAICNAYAEPVDPDDPSAGYCACEVDTSTQPDRCVRNCAAVLCADLDGDDDDDYDGPDEAVSDSVYALKLAMVELHVSGGGPLATALIASELHTEDGAVADGRQRHLR